MKYPLIYERFIKNNQKEYEMIHKPLAGLMKTEDKDKEDEGENNSEEDIGDPK